MFDLRKFAQDRAIMATLLLVTHVAIRQGPRGHQIDDQTAAGIAQWCRHFDKVTYFGIADKDSSNVSSTAWTDLIDTERCELIELPRAYDVRRMLKEYQSVRMKLRAAVSQHDHLCFTIGSLFGDWPAVAALEAMRQKRRFAVWIDRVEPLVIRNKLNTASSATWLFGRAALPVIEQGIRYLLRHSEVALLQGRDTFDYYGRSAPDPHCTYDTHTNTRDQILSSAVAEKQRRILEGLPLNILYVGRAAAMKGPADWLDTLERLLKMQVPFRATWIGDGPELSKMKERVAASALSGVVYLPGFVGGRDAVLRAMRESDLLLFCHKTPESPRSLIEALVSGCPLVGYEMAYAKGLVETRGGAAFAPQDDVAMLAERVATLHRDRASMSRLIAAAAASGELYNEDAVYAHRASLMQRA